MFFTHDTELTLHETKFFFQMIFFFFPAIFYYEKNINLLQLLSLIAFPFALKAGGYPGLIQASQFG